MLAHFSSFTYLFLLLFVALGWLGDFRDVSRTGAHTALIDIDGVIASDGLSSAENINTSLKSAFEDKNTRGVILRINSPGGSPVQSGYINDEIHRLRNIYPDIPVLIGGIGFIAMGHVISALYRNARVIALMRNKYRKGILEKMKPNARLISFE